MSEEYGIEEEGIGPTDEDGVSVPQIHIQLSEEHKSLLKETINPLESCDDCGTSLYLRTFNCWHHSIFTASTLMFCLYDPLPKVSSVLFLNFVILYQRQRSKVLCYSRLAVW